MQTNRKGKMDRKVTVQSITESHELLSYDQPDEVCQKPKPCPSPRNRSHSVIDCGFTENMMKMANSDLASESGSTDQILSQIESLPKLYRRSNRRIGRINSQLLVAVELGNVEEVNRLLEAGASPNTTYHVDYISACHIAALTPGGALAVLLKFGAVSNRSDRLGRTPLHIAAWAGQVRNLGLLLNIPEAILENINRRELSLEDEEQIRRLQPQLQEVVNSRCELGEMRIQVPKEWRDVLDYSSKVAEQMPYFPPGWTPLHAASCSARQHCVRLLLAAGADPGLRDVISRTPLDVAGSAYYAHPGTQLCRNSLPANSPGFKQVVAMLLSRERQGVRKRALLSPLHTAVELNCVESVALLLEAGACVANLNRDGETPLHVAIRKRLKEHLQMFLYSRSSVVDVRDKDGNTVLHFSVLANWLPGVYLALESGANTTSRSHKGETPLHSASELGYLDILKEILKFNVVSNIIEERNLKGETALFKAVAKNNIECARFLLEQGASIEATLPDKKNVFHVAAFLGFYDMLKLLLDYNNYITRVIINHVTAENKGGYGPIHLAVQKDHIECVKLLLSKNAYINLKSTGGRKGVTPLHIAAIRNNTEITKLILMNNHSSMYMQDGLGLNALHTACYHSSRDVIKLLLSKGCDISEYSGGENRIRKTAVDLIINNISKPTMFFHEIFDSCFTCNDRCPQDPKCEVTVNYEILVPNKHINGDSINDIEMKVLEALLKTGNNHGQRRLLIHPLVESFLCLKWEALLPFFYAMLVIYGLFVLTLTIFVISVYMYRNDNIIEEIIEENNEEKLPERPVWMDCTAWSYVLYVTISLVVCQEFLYMKVSRRYFFQLETWVKISSTALAGVLPQVVYTSGNWARHLAAVTVLLSWLQMTFFLSRFPRMGYYVLMFKKVSTKVLKILLTFVFLLIGFSLSFMVEYHSRAPFENPWSAFVKTMVMMTSEFDYDDLVDKNHHKIPLTVIRPLFLIFLVLAAIVLMNLMVAVAVNDLNDLEVLGKIMRLEKQIEFLVYLDTVVNYRYFMKMLPRGMKYKLEFARSLSQVCLRPCEPSWSYLKAIPAHVKDSILDIAHSQNKRINDQMSNESINKKIDAMFEYFIKQDKMKMCNKNVKGEFDDFETVTLRPGREFLKGRKSN